MLKCTFFMLFIFLRVVSRTIAEGSRDELERKYKFLVAIELHGNHVCSGTIVHAALIVTVGSCLIRSNVPTDYTIRAGPIIVSNLHVHNNTVFKIVGLIYNPNFVWMGQQRKRIYDAAILVLSEPLVFTDKIGKIELPAEREDIHPNTKALVVGWNGYRLHVQKVIVLSNMDCYLKNKRFGANLHDYPVDSQICANSFAKCDKDIGIPLIADNKIYGMYSNHYQGCESGSPPMFTRMSKIRSWIYTIIRRYDSLK
ncbi:trypsin-5-like [Chrysoperla carnea]|uniref:trypsin-5-like n=1 Tax=Chrysoperla carnea TaxID=189513 RepID=UPI001D08595B|nr:trypsin-5-like [Chrysoperla carnea]